MVGIEHPALQLLICTHYEMEKIKEYRNGVKSTMWFFIIIFFSIFILLNSDTSYHSWEGKIDRLWSFIVTITSSFNSIFLNLLYLMFLSKPHKNVWIHIIKGRMKKHVLSFHVYWWARKLETKIPHESKLNWIRNFFMAHWYYLCLGMQTDASTAFLISSKT